MAGYSHMYFILLGEEGNVNVKKTQRNDASVTASGTRLQDALVRMQGLFTHYSETNGPASVRVGSDPKASEPLLWCLLFGDLKGAYRQEGFSVTEAAGSDPAVRRTEVWPAPRKHFTEYPD